MYKETSRYGMPEKTTSKRPLGPDQKYVLSMVNPEWPGGAPSDGRSLRGLQSLQKRGLAQLVNNKWSITPAGTSMLHELEAAGEA